MSRKNSILAYLSLKKAEFFYLCAFIISCSVVLNMIFLQPQDLIIQVPDHCPVRFLLLKICVSVFLECDHVVSIDFFFFFLFVLYSRLSVCLSLRCFYVC